jgi:hypothetical protein
MRESRALPAQHAQVTEILLFAEKTAIIVYSATPLVVLIEDPAVFAMFKTQFTIFWKLSK